MNRFPKWMALKGSVDTSPSVPYYVLKCRTAPCWLLRLGVNLVEAGLGADLGGSSNYSIEIVED
jgi:hypothetical protein